MGNVHLGFENPPFIVIVIMTDTSDVGARMQISITKGIGPGGDGIGTIGIMNGQPYYMVHACGVLGWHLCMVALNFVGIQRISQGGRKKSHL